MPGRVCGQVLGAVYALVLAAFFGCLVVIKVLAGGKACSHPGPSGWHSGAAGVVVVANEREGVASCMLCRRGAAGCALLSHA